MTVVTERLGPSLKLLKEAVIFAVTFPVTCGSVRFNDRGVNRRVEVHDHGEQKMVGDYPGSAVPYDPKTHGQLLEFVEEGQPVSHMKNAQGQLMIHRHGSSSRHGPHEYHLEEVNT